MTKVAAVQAAPAFLDRSISRLWRGNALEVGIAIAAQATFAKQDRILKQAVI